jgi:hypothetical protein
MHGQHDAVAALPGADGTEKVKFKLNRLNTGSVETDKF